MKLEERLLRYRKNSNLTQEDVADKLDVTRQTISNWENGTAIPSVVKAQELMELYGETLNDLMLSVDEEPILQSFLGKEVKIIKEDETIKGKIVKIDSQWITLNYSDKKGEVTKVVNIESIHAIVEVQ